MRAATLLAMAAGAAAHYQMLYPQSYFSDDDEPTAPCGGYNLNTTVDFHAGGDQIVLKTSHPVVTYRVRVASNNDVTTNVTNLYNSDIQENGPGTMCLQNVMVPSSFVGTTGVLQIIGDSPDGILYQCSSVRFVSGAAPSTSSQCTNSSAVSASYVQDTKLAAAAGTNTTNSTSTNSSSSGTTTTSSSAAASSSHSAAGRMVESAQGLLTAALFGGIAFFASTL